MATNTHDQLACLLAMVPCYGCCYGSLLLLCLFTPSPSPGTSPFPKPVGGAVIGLPDGRVLGMGRSDHQQDAVLHAISAAGLTVVPLSEWVVSWPSSPKLRSDLKEATLYVTMEPSNDRQGDMAPSLTQLIAQCGLTRVVIGCADPVPEKATEGAAALHKAGLEVILGVEEETCQDLIQEYAHLANTKLQKFARRHFARTGQVSTVPNNGVPCNKHVHSFIGR
jgi:pyrimidine deaminase RibD-like protein